jgi:hypothetical protein
MYIRPPSCSSRRASRSITKSLSLPPLLFCVFLSIGTRPVEVLSTSSRPISRSLALLSLCSHFFSHFHLLLGRHSHSCSTKLSNTTLCSSSPSHACEGAAPSRDSLCITVLAPGHYINSCCARINSEPIPMCLMTYMLYLSTCPYMLSLPMHGASVSFFNSVHYYYQASAFQGATSPVRKYKERAGGYGAPDWIGKQGYYVDTLRRLGCYL